MSTVRALLITISIFVSAVAVAVLGVVMDGPSAASVPAAPSYIGASHVDCGQSWAWSHRVCYDTGSKWFHIYTAPPYQQPNLSFPSNSGASGIGQYAGQAGIFNVTNNSCNDEARWNGGNFIHIWRSTGNCGLAFVANIVYGPFYDGGNQIGMYGGNWNYLVWYLSVNGYDFVITTR